MPVSKSDLPEAVRPSPRTSRATKARMVVSRNDVVIYGNRAAFSDLAAWMSYLAASPPSEHDELHFPWHMQSHFAAVPRIAVVDRSSGRQRRFELTFIVVENADLRPSTRHDAPQPVRSMRARRRR